MTLNVNTVFEGQLQATDMKFAIVCGRFNEFFVSKLLSGAIDTISRNGGSTDLVDVAWVPGCYEIPLAAQKLAQSGKYDAVICLGVVIQGATPHADHLNAEVTKGIAHVGLQTGLPVTYGIITANNIEQAIERSGTKAGNKGVDAAITAIEMVSLLTQLS
ncbi:MAG: 6,7-dimethyl-8-ribityllumazine synthase [Lentisphaeria bacterium]|nr:6,7-dimethyl-8-ribityllumazine synthase [Lentisphaeria bacterium]